jgi:hypothetical protein
MLKIYLGIAFILLISLNRVSGQNRKLTAQVTDNRTNISLRNASVALLQQRDSILIGDTRTDEKGNFSFDHLQDSGSYILLITFPKYVDYSQVLSMNNAIQGVLSLNKISLMKTEIFLEDIIVKSQVRSIKIKNDTIEYKADSFRVQANATVEDLLKQLPGLQVDQYGNITAQGQKVKKVLVDGEEFFSDDPTLITRNIRADMIDNIQVYDRKSDAATFTGIDDGIKVKTINLKIKETKKNGNFGKIEIQGGNTQHYNSQTMLNSFKKNSKISVFNTVSNIGRVGLGAADKQKIGFADDGGETYDGVGLPSVVSGGLHYENKWNADNENINSNYKFITSTTTGSENIISQNNLSIGTILSNRDFIFNTHSTNSKFNTTYVYKPDTISIIKIYFDADIANRKNTDSSFTQNRRGNSNSRIYENDLYRNNDYNYNNYNLNLSWEKKFKTNDRTISLYFKNNLFYDDAKGESRSGSKFYDQGNNLDSTASLHLKKQMTDKSHSLSLKIIYTRILNARLALALNYQITNEITNGDKRSFNFSNSSTIKTIDSTFSSVLNSSFVHNQSGVSFNYNFSKSTFRIGGNIGLVNINISDHFFQPQSFKKQFVNWNPQLTIVHKIDNYRSIDVNYFGMTLNPEGTQILPSAYNNSQLMTYLPNLQLENSFSHRVTFNYKSAKSFSQIYSGIYVNYNAISNPITLSLFADPGSGIYTYRHINMPNYDNSSYTGSLFFSKKSQKLDAQITAYGNINGGKLFTAVDNLVNKLTYNLFSVGFEVHKSKLKKYEIHLTQTLGYSLNKYSIQPLSNNNFLFYNINPSADLFFPANLQLHTDASYVWQQRTQTFDNNFNRVIWNAWLGRNFLKNDQLTIKISSTDILNQNNGYSRTAINTFFSESRYTTIRRFFMFGATWNFTRLNSGNN